MFTSWHYCNIYESAQIGEGTSIGSYTEVGDKVKIGENCRIQAHCFIPAGIEIRDNVFVGPGTVFCNDKHPDLSKEFIPEKTLVRDWAVIGANCTILPGVVIGHKAVVGAGSVVTRDVGDGETVMGGPLRHGKMYECEFCHKTFFSTDMRGVRFCSRVCYNRVRADEDLKVKLNFVDKDYKILAKFKEYKRGCEKRGLNFDLSFDEFKTYWRSKCFYCGGEIETIGLDRVDNNRGYSNDNIVSCCWDCNRLKGDMNQKEFLDKIKSISDKLCQK